MVDALLLPHHSDVADEIAAAALEPLVGRRQLHALKARSAAHDEHPLGRHAAALDRDAPIGLVRSDRHVGGAESPVLELQHQTMEEITSAELRLVELGVKIMVIEDELLAEQLKKSADEEEQVGRIAGVNDVETAREEHPPGEHKGPGERDRVFHGVACRARRLDQQAVAVNVDPVDRLELALARSEERRVGKECRARWTRSQY